MEEKKENLSGMIAGTLLIVSSLMNFAEFNIERGFLDYPVLIFRAVAALAGITAAATVMGRKSFWPAGIGILISGLCRLYKPGISDYMYMAECAAIIVILIVYGLGTYKDRTLNLDWSRLVGIGFCAVWIIWQIYFIKGFMNKEILGEGAVLRMEACQKGFCYLLEEAALTAFLWDVILHTNHEEKYETGMELSRRLSVIIAVILFIAAAWNVWPAIFLVPAYRSRGYSLPVSEIIILALLAAGMAGIGAALIKRGKKIRKKTALSSDK